MKKRHIAKLGVIACCIVSLIAGMLLTPIGSAYAAENTVMLYKNGNLFGTYGDIMSAFGQMTDAAASYTVRLTDDVKDYLVDADYTWPKVEQLKIEGPNSNTFGFLVLQGNNTLQGDLELQGIVITDNGSEDNAEYTLDIQDYQLYLSGDVHIQGEQQYINLLTGQFTTKIVAELVGDTGSEVVVEGKTELHCNTNVDKMTLAAGQLLFRAGQSRHTMNVLECYEDGWGVELSAIYFMHQVGGGVNVDIGTFIKRGNPDVLGQSQNFSISTDYSTLEIGDVIFEHEIGAILSFYWTNHNGAPGWSSEIKITGKVENISEIYFQNHRNISTYSAYKEEFGTDKLFTAPNYMGEVDGRFSARFMDTGEQSYDGGFEVVKRDGVFYADMDSLYLNEPVIEDEYLEITSGEWIYRVVDGGAVVSGYIGVGKEVVEIPERIDGYPVSKISQLERILYDEDGRRFSSLKGVREVVIPKTATEVSPHAFMIHELFGDITVLEKLTVAEGNPAYKSVDGVVYTANGETIVAVPQAIESMEVPDGTKYIDEYAFYRCIRLKKLYLPDSIEYISGGGLRETNALVDLRLSQNMEDIPFSVGIGCDSLKRLYMPKQKICTMACADSHGYGGGIFNGCANLDEIVFFDDNIKLWENTTEIFNYCAPDLVMYCKPGSETDKLLKELGFKTKSLEELTPLRIYDEDMNLEVGETHQNYLLRNPYDEDFFESSISWKSSNEAVATVDQDGLITAVSAGECAISASCNGETTSTKVQVVESIGPDLSGLFATYENCNFTKDGDDVRCYNIDGTPVINEFKCDGTYTYYFQADGTAMRDRLTYHPDGEHVIYFDESGHEIFSNFANVKKTIAGEEVDDYCFFDVYGYLYVDVVTYDQTGTYLYYANPYGVMDRDKWFEFSDSVKWADGTPFDKAGGKYGYANEDGTLMTNQWTYDWEGRKCYMQGNGVALY